MKTAKLLSPWLHTTARHTVVETVSEKPFIISHGNTVLFLAKLDLLKVKTLFEPE
jgi:hypothetical protein